MEFKLPKPESDQLVQVEASMRLKNVQFGMEHVSSESSLETATPKANNTKQPEENEEYKNINDGTKSAPMLSFGQKKKQVGGGFLGLNFKKLDDDFLIPDESKWKREKTMGQGAYGKVMEIIYLPLGQAFAVKRFE